MNDDERRRNPRTLEGDEMCDRNRARGFIAAVSAVFVFAHTGSAWAKCLTGAADDDRRYGPLFTLTAERFANAADKQRAAVFLATVRATLRYDRRHAAAQASDYDFDNSFVWGPYENVPRRRNARPAAATFDPRRPTSLLFTPSSTISGAAVLVGAAYTAVSDTTGDSLNGIVPLSIARWVRVHPRCTMPRPDLWTLEVFPFEKSAKRIWQVPPNETYVAPSSFPMPWSHRP